MTDNSAPNILTADFFGVLIGLKILKPQSHIRITLEDGSVDYIHISPTKTFAAKFRLRMKKRYGYKYPKERKNK